MQDVDHIKKVNALIKKSFGRFYRGNYHIVGGGVSGGALIEKQDSLATLASKMAWLGFGDPSMGVGVKGVFNADGSIVVVLEKYEYQAKKYAELYHQEFGKEVRVITKSDFYELFPAQGLASQSPFPLDVNSL